MKAVIKNLCLQSNSINGISLSSEAMKQLREKLIGVNVYFGYGNPDEPRQTKDLAGMVTEVDGDDLIMDLADVDLLSAGIKSELDFIGRVEEKDGVRAVEEIKILRGVFLTSLQEEEKQ